jgi:hypothetical protein
MVRVGRSYDRLFTELNCCNGLFLSLLTGRRQRTVPIAFKISTNKEVSAFVELVIERETVRIKCSQ